MIDPEMRRAIQEEIRRQMNVVLNAETGATDPAAFTEVVSNLFPGQGSTDPRPVSHPFGFVSRAVLGTISVIARVGDHFGNRMVIGHRDKGRPTDIGEGETCAYSSSGYRIVWRSGSLMIGKGSDLEPLVMGQTLLEFLSGLTSEIVQHTHAAPGAPPTDAAAFTALKTNYLDNAKILPQDGGRF